MSEKNINKNNLSREAIIEKRKLICNEIFLLQSDYRKRSKAEQQLLDKEIRRYGKQLEQLTLPRKTVGSLYNKKMRGLVK